MKLGVHGAFGAPLGSPASLCFAIRLGGVLVHDVSCDREFISGEFGLHWCPFVNLRASLVAKGAADRNH